MDVIIEKMADQGGAATFKELIDYLDKAIAQLVLGHELSSQGSAGGGLLGISAALQVRQDILEADCNFVSETIKRDILMPLVGWNYGWDVVDLVPDLAYRFEPPKDLVAQANVTEVIARTFPTMPWSLQKVRDDFSVDAPVGSDESGRDDQLLPGGGPTAPGAAPNAEPPPSAVPDLRPGSAPDVSINSARKRGLNAYSRRPRPAPRYSPARQKRIDKLADRGIALGTSIVDDWRRQIRDAIRTAAKEGVPASEVRRRLIALYPELDATQLEQSIKEESLKARLFGRNA
jgi:phage gp29-like protein